MIPGEPAAEEDQNGPQQPMVHALQLSGTRPKVGVHSAPPALPEPTPIRYGEARSIASFLPDPTASPPQRQRPPSRTDAPSGRPFAAPQSCPGSPVELPL